MRGWKNKRKGREAVSVVRGKSRTEPRSFWFQNRQDFYSYSYTQPKMPPATLYQRCDSTFILPSLFTQPLRAAFSAMAFKAVHLALRTALISSPLGFSRVLWKSSPLCVFVYLSLYKSQSLSNKNKKQHLILLKDMPSPNKYSRLNRILIPEKQPNRTFCTSD